MPAVNDDPAAPAIRRVSEQPPNGDLNNPHLPTTVFPKQVTLRDRVTAATLGP